VTVRMFPRLLVACFALALTGSVAAQTNDPDGRPRSVPTNQVTARPIEPVLVTIPPTRIEERAPLTSIRNGPLLTRFHDSLTAAIEERLGSHYHYGGTGPEAFDCSGFVWSSFQAAGVKFQRGPARSYWAAFAPATKDDEFKFGTLVFFSGLTHVGIVADEKGFYHSSRHHGVVYAPFNDYWLSRIDGFRRLSLELMQAPLNEKARAGKPATNAQSVEDQNAP
jgi:cell wall-associated NlpC family hydrolase